jgi:hypothetical protein
MRDKLIELIKYGLLCPNMNTPFGYACDTCQYAEAPECDHARLADHLIFHGVTFAPDNNVPCKFCQEDKDGCRAMFGAFSIHNPFHGSTWEIATGHCKPRQIYFCPMCGRKLSEPPKEVET